MLILYTGRGKGKTSGAISLAIRSLISDKKVGYIQFLKSRGTSESKLESFFPELDFFSYGTNAFVDPKNPSQLAKEEAKKGWIKAKELFKTKDLIVLDELVVTLLFGLIDKQEVIDTLKEFSMALPTKPSSYSWPIVVITGIDAPQKLVDIADLVTEMKEIKHPFRQGYLATRGIDF